MIMIEVNAKDHSITISRGDTGVIDITFTGDIPSDNTLCIVSLKKDAKQKTPIWEKELQITEGAASFAITPDDTIGLDFKTYKWDIRLFTDDGHGNRQTVTPFIPADFTVVEVIGNDR